MTTKIAVIVPAYNAAKTLPACLEGLVNQDLSQCKAELEILVVDDGSTDETAQVIDRYAGQVGGNSIPEVCLVHLARRGGAAAARNAGVKAASPACSIVLFTDADCVPAPDWAAQLTTALEQAGTTIAGIKGIYRTRQESPVAQFAQAEFDERYARFTRLGVQPDFADTYCAAYRRDLLLQYPFDERLPGAIVEDAELGWRLRQAGYSFIFEAQAIVYHQHVTRFRAYFKRKFRIGRWRMVLYRSYPGQLPSDSHTSQLAKLQMVLLAASLGGFGLGGLSKLLELVGLNRALARFGWLLSIRSALFSLLALQVSFGPFIWRTSQKFSTTSRTTSQNVLVVLALLNLRTIAFTSGALVGLVQLILVKRK